MYEIRHHLILSNWRGERLLFWNGYFHPVYFRLSTLEESNSAAFFFQQRELKDKVWSCSNAQEDGSFGEGGGSVVKNLHLFKERQQQK